MAIAKVAKLRVQFKNKPPRTYALIIQKRVRGNKQRCFFIDIYIPLFVYVTSYHSTTIDMRTSEKDHGLVCVRLYTLTFNFSHNYLYFAYSCLYRYINIILPLCISLSLLKTYRQMLDAAIREQCRMCAYRAKYSKAIRDIQCAFRCAAVSVFILQCVCVCVFDY